jgi:hypothetical protein
MKHLLNNLTEEEKNSIRGQHTGGMNVVTENFSKLINTKSGDVKLFLKEQETQGQQDVKTMTNKVASEGIKNVTPEMMAAPQFKGQYSGYVFGGVFNGVNYEWDCNDVPGMSGVRGMVEGEIISETSKNMFAAIKKYPGDNNPESPCVGFYSKNGSFIIYTTSDGKTNCINF